jgi:hypothetical protein
METKGDESELDYVLGNYFLIEALSEEGARKYLDNPKYPARKVQFKAELADAIKNRTITREGLYKLTGDLVDSEDDVQDFLVNEVWKEIFPGEPTP